MGPTPTEGPQALPGRCPFKRCSQAAGGPAPHVRNVEGELVANIALVKPVKLRAKQNIL